MATQSLAFRANKQASSAKKILFQNETELKQISLTQPLERDYYIALKRYIAGCNRLAIYRPQAEV